MSLQTIIDQANAYLTTNQALLVDIINSEKSKFETPPPIHPKTAFYASCLLIASINNTQFMIHLDHGYAGFIRRVAEALKAEALKAEALTTEALTGSKFFSLKFREMNVWVKRYRDETIYEDDWNSPCGDASHCECCNPTTKKLKVKRHKIGSLVGFKTDPPIMGTLSKSERKRIQKNRDLFNRILEKKVIYLSSSVTIILNGEELTETSIYNTNCQHFIGIDDRVDDEDEY